VRQALGRPLVRSSRGVVTRPLDGSPDRSLAMLLDVSMAGVLVCSRPCSLSGRRYCCLTGCGSGRDTGGLNGSGCRCWFGPGAGRGREDAGQWGQFLPGAV
jgi:hypothetical protein